MVSFVPQCRNTIARSRLRTCASVFWSTRSTPDVRTPKCPNQPRITDYVNLRRGLGHSFATQAATLRAFARFVHQCAYPRPLTRDIAMGFVLACDVTPNVRQRRHAVVVRFADYLAIFDARTEALDPRALPRSRATSPPRLLDEGELARLLVASRAAKALNAPLRGETLYTIVGLLASTGLRSGEALRLDRADLVGDLLRIRQSKFHKDRLVPVHPTMGTQLLSYADERDRTFPQAKSPAFFLSSRGVRLSHSSFGEAFRQARASAQLCGDRPRGLRPHDLRHRFAVTRLVTWYREGIDVQAQLPLLATYLGHVRYSDTAYYITGTAHHQGEI